MSTEVYTLELTDDAEADLERLDKTVARRVVSKLKRLSDNAGVINHVALNSILYIYGLLASA